MDDRSSLLEQLKIDRSEAQDSGGVWRWVVLGVVLAGLTGASGWYYLSRPQPVAIAVAIAERISTSMPAV
ncbi:MAG: hypothetical protein PVF63_01535, partial [Gammaproteobacteria bacterium]